MELFILTVKPIENKYTRTLIFFAYFCNKQIPYPVFFVKAPTPVSYTHLTLPTNSRV